MLIKSADIIIIGGGLLGCATAYQLSKRTSCSIVLYERNDIASQATSRAACLLTRARTKPALMSLVQETYDCIAELSHLLNDSLGYTESGSITAVSELQSHVALDDLYVAATVFGLQASWIDGHQVKSKLPWMETSSVTKALYMPTDAYIDSAMLCNGYLTGAKQNGVGVTTRVGVTNILSHANQVTGVELSTGEIVHAPIVINATGAWINRMIYPQFAALATVPVRSHFWISESIPTIFPINQPFAILPDARAFTRPDVGGLIIGIREPECVAYDPSQWPDDIDDVDFSPDNGWRTLSQSVNLFEQYFPSIHDLRIAHYVAGPSCYTPDSMFIVGPLEPTAGLFVAGGCCGGGVAMSGGIGRMMSEIVLGETCFVDQSLFSPSRFVDVHPYSATLRKQCADARSNKKGG